MFCVCYMLKCLLMRAVWRLEFVADFQIEFPPPPPILPADQQGQSSFDFWSTMHTYRYFLDVSCHFVVTAIQMDLHNWNLQLNCCDCRTILIVKRIRQILCLLCRILNDIQSFQFDHSTVRPFQFDHCRCYFLRICLCVFRCMFASRWALLFILLLFLFFKIIDITFLWFY